MFEENPNINRRVGRQLFYQSFCRTVMHEIFIYGKNENIPKWVREFNEFYLSLWKKGEEEFPLFSTKISYFRRLANERRVEEFRKKFLNELDRILKKEDEVIESTHRILSFVKELEYSIIGREEKYIEFFIDKGYLKVTQDFIKEVRKFDPEIELSDIFQAIRNVWIMNSIQVILGMKVELTPSIFSYSMLYPYSDNYLDDPTVSMREKRDFNAKFRKWLIGKTAEASNFHEKQIQRLVKRIENQFSRSRFPQVFESLIAIHTAQESSLLQQQKDFDGRDVIDISFKKGGTSVLADGYLVKGDLTKEEAEFLHGYGIFLQLIDDLQDVEIDFNNGHRTIFSQAIHQHPLDQTVNKLFRFIEKVLEGAAVFKSNDVVKIKEILHFCSAIMIMEAVAKNRKWFSSKYLKKLERFSMLRFSYFNQLKTRFERTMSIEEIERVLIYFYGRERSYPINAF